MSFLQALENQLIDLIIPWETLLMEITECWGPAGRCTLTLLGWGRRDCSAPLKPLLPPHPKQLDVLISLFPRHKFLCLEEQFSQSCKVLQLHFKIPLQQRGDLRSACIHGMDGDCSKAKAPRGFWAWENSTKSLCCHRAMPMGLLHAEDMLLTQHHSPGACSSTASSTHTRQHHFNQ